MEWTVLDISLISPGFLRIPEPVALAGWIGHQKRSLGLFSGFLWLILSQKEIVTHPGSGFTGAKLCLGHHADPIQAPYGGHLGTISQ